MGGWDGVVDARVGWIGMSLIIGRVGRRGGRAGVRGGAIPPTAGVRLSGWLRGSVVQRALHDHNLQSCATSPAADALHEPVRVR